MMTETRVSVRCLEKQQKQKEFNKKKKERERKINQNNHPEKERERESKNVLAILPRHRSTSGAMIVSQSVISPFFQTWLLLLVPREICGCNMRNNHRKN